jgi:hypothetical protein
MLKRSYDVQSDLYSPALAASAASTPRPRVVPRSVGAQFHAAPLTNSAGSSITTIPSNEQASVIRKRHVTAPLQSHLEQNTIRMLMEGSRKLSRSGQQPQSITPKNNSSSAFASACQDCERPIDSAREELVACMRCGAHICSNCCTKAVYAGGATDTILCLRCT